MRLLSQFLIGLLFGIGLVLAGMSNPAKVLNFLDVTAISQGGWDGSLALVMAGGVGVAAIGYRIVFKRREPVFSSDFHVPKSRTIDAPLVIGAVLFGLGWGLIGLCPGPAFTALASGKPGAFVFMAAMLAGMFVARVMLDAKQKQMSKALLAEADG
jgi:uncharacterized protein